MRSFTFVALCTVALALGCRKSSATRLVGIVEDPEPPGSNRIRSIAAAPSHLCVLYADGTVACGGDGAKAALGSPIAEHAAVKIDGVRGARRLSVGACSACALDAGGTLTCWGFRGAFCAEGGQLVLPRPTVVEGVRFHLVPTSSFLDSIWAVDEDGDIRTVGVSCLKPRTKETLGTPCTKAKLVHEKFPSSAEGFFAPGALADAVETTAASAYCKLTPGGGARCWNDHITDGQGRTFPELDAPAEPVVRISGNFGTTCFVLQSGGVECRSTDGIVAPPLAGAAKTAAGGYRDGCATGRDGSLTCWTFVRVPQELRRRPERPSAKVTRYLPNAHARMVVHDGSTFCTLDDQDVVRCAVETDAPWVLTLP